MKRMVVLLGIVLIDAILIGCGSKNILPEKIPAPEILSPERQIIEKEPWEVEWEKTLQEAKKERKVVIFMAASPETVRAISESFYKKFGLTLETYTGRGPEQSSRIIAERNRGIFTSDIFTGGSTTIIQPLKPAGVLESLSPMLILPEVKEPGYWWQNRLPFIDKDKYGFAFMASRLGKPIVINTTIIKPDELRTYNDLLELKWKGRIALYDPTVPGRGNSWFSIAMYTKSLEAETLKRLTSQDIFISRDHRQLVEWNAQGKFPIVIAADTATINHFQQAGAPIEEIKLKEDIPYVVSGIGALALLTKPAHPNASRVFINWLLSKEGQTIWSKMELGHSARNDVPAEHLPPDRIRRPGENTFFADQEEFLIWRGTEAIQLAREIFSK